MDVIFAFIFILFIVIVAHRLVGRRNDNLHQNNAGETTDNTATSNEESGGGDALHELAAKIEDYAKKSAYPTDLLNHPEFQKGVALLSSDKYSTEDLLKYYSGFNFVINCMALETLAQRKDDADLLEPILSQLNDKAFYTVYFALRTLNARISGPLIGAVLANMNEFWTESILQQFLHDFLQWRLEKGEKLTFGDALKNSSLEDADAIELAVKELDNKLAKPLLKELEAWQQAAVDVKFLESVGRLWEDEPDENWIEHAQLKSFVQNLERTLNDENPRSVLLVGESGVGKTAIAHVLADRLKKSGWVIFEAGSSDVLAGQMYIGQLEERVQSLMQKISGRRKVLWVVPKFHELRFAGSHKYSPVSMLDMIFPYVERGEITLLGETHPAAFERLIQRAPRIRTGMEIYRVSPLQNEETLALARQWISSKSSDAHKPVISEETLREAFQLTQQYLGDKATPGNLLQFLDLTHKRLSGGDQPVQAISIDEMLVTLSQLTGLPINILDERQGLDLEQLHTTFYQRVMGQKEAVDCLVERVAMIKAGLTDPGRPQGVFLFAGPTGTGKTEIAKTLAGFLFGSEQRMIRLDMSEFQTPDSLDRILGSRDDGARDSGALVNLIRKQPFSVVLLDEFEKSHPNAWDIFLQVFDDGRLTDRHGNTADFRHCIIIMTSNLGGVIPTGASIGFTTGEQVFTSGKVSKAITKTFRKEFLNRIDRVVVFQPLSRSVMRDVLRRELEEVLQRRGLRSRTWAVEFDNSAIEFLLDKGFTADLGARPLKRAIERYLLSPLAMTIVNHQFPEGDQFLFVRSKGKLIEVEFIDPDLPETEPAESPAAASAETGAGLTLSNIIFDARGNDAEAAFLQVKLENLAQTVENRDWRQRKQHLLSQTASPGFWDSPNRFEILGQAEYMDRIDAGFATARRLAERLVGTKPGKRQHFSRTLMQRLAHQIYLLEAAARGSLENHPQDAFVLVEAGRDSQITDLQNDTFAAQIALMYLQWAEKRRMRHKILEERKSGGKTPFRMLIAIAGYAAFDILEKEAGLHVLEFPAERNTVRRCKARVRIAPQPPEPAGNFSDALHQQALQAFANAEKNGQLAIVRRYREAPSPLVRDSVRNWRTGRLDRVLGGDFDLMG